ERRPQSGLICAAGTTNVRISPDGNVYPCISLKKNFGSIFEESIADIWKSDERKNYVNSLTWENMHECPTCELQPYCSHCVAHSEGEIADLFKCNTCDRTLVECIYSLTKSREDFAGNDA
ncbi:MAG: SPASM domain-containing protein, partial [Synergistaceae bacterium]|nr:SPASM domain-containing protein [Synergistaceae bacterium]